MNNKFYIQLKHLSYTNFKKICRLQSYGLILLSILLAILAMYFQYSAVVYVILLLEVVVFLLLAFLTNSIMKTLDSILYDECNPIRYETWIDCYYQGVPAFFKHLQAMYQFRKGEVAYWKGEFRTSKSLFNVINVHYFLKRLRLKMSAEILYYQVLSDIQLDFGGDLERIKLDFEMLNQSEYYASLEAINRLLILRLESKYFQSLTPKNTLEQLSIYYYLGRNALLVNDKQSAKEYFERLADSSSELFMVKEARKWSVSNEN